MKRHFHHWQSWECIGMYSCEETFDADKAMHLYAEFLKDSPRFRSALNRVLKEWPRSCEQFLSNDSINRIAWLGQASMYIETGIPRRFRAGFKLLTDEEQREANRIANDALLLWQREQRLVAFTSQLGFF